MAYQNILKNYFKGDAQQYANMIKAKESSPAGLSNPNEAAAFKAARPDLFQVSSISSLKSPSSFNAPKQRPISYESARTQAESQVDPIYRQNLQQALTRVKNETMNSGFFGQPGQLQYSADTAGTIEAEKQRMVADLTEAIRQRNAEEQSRLFSQALQAWQANRGAFESDRGYGYQVGRDQIGDQRYLDERKIDNERWGKTIGLQESGLSGYYVDPVTGERKPTMAREEMTANNAYRNRSLTQRSSGGGGNSSGYTLTPNQTISIITDEVNDFYGEVEKGDITKEKAVAAIEKYRNYPDVYNALMAEIERVFPGQTMYLEPLGPFKPAS